MMTKYNNNTANTSQICLTFIHTYCQQYLQIPNSLEHLFLVIWLIHLPCIYSFTQQWIKCQLWSSTVRVLKGSMHAEGRTGRQAVSVSLGRVPRDSLSLTSKLSGCFCVFPTMVGWQSHTITANFLSGCWGFELRSPCLRSKCFCPLSCLPSSGAWFLDLWAMVPGWNCVPEYRAHRKLSIVKTGFCVFCDQRLSQTQMLMNTGLWRPLRWSMLPLQPWFWTQNTCTLHCAYCCSVQTDGHFRKYLGSDSTDALQTAVGIWSFLFL